MVSGLAGLAVGIIAVSLFVAGRDAPAPDPINDVYPLFRIGISWSPKVQVEVPPRSNYNPTGQTIVGYQITSLPTASTVDIGATVGPMRDYYDRVLLQKGWSINPKFQADGPGGSLWGFTKDDDVLILSYTSSAIDAEHSRPKRCPCTIVFTIIGGTLR